MRTGKSPVKRLRPFVGGVLLLTLPRWRHSFEKRRFDMKVLHLIGGGDVGGAKTHVITLLTGLSKSMDVTLVSFREGEFAAECRDAGIDVRVVEGGIFDELRTVRSLVKGYDIIHCHGARANLVGMLLRRKLGKPIVTTVHSDYRLDYLGRPLARLTFGQINSFALRRLDFHIGVSDPTSEMLITRGFPAERQYTIYNGIDFHIDEFDFDRAAAARELGLPFEEGDIVAGIAARFDPVKDLPTFIRAAARLRRNCPRLRFAVAGSGPQADELQKLARELNAPVHFCGWVSDMNAFFRLTDINVLTSLYETFPYVLTEGTRMSCATVATAVGGIPMLIDHGINGLLFQPGDDIALAAHLQALYDDPALMRQMGDKLHEKAMSMYSIEATLQRQKQIYQDVLRRWSRPRKPRDGLILCGAYGMDNAGDDAILEAILQEIHELDPDIPIRVLSRNPIETRITYREHAFHTFNLFAFTRAVLQSGIYLSGGGNLVQDTTSRRSLWFYLFTIFWANKLGCRVFMYGCGVGPVNSPFNRRRTADVLNKRVEVITLRERMSKAELDRMGVSRPAIELTADPALILTPADAEKVDSLMLRQDIAQDGRYICFALRNWPGYAEALDSIGAAADYAYKVYHLTPVFIPVDRKQDVEAARWAAQHTTCPHILMTEAGSARVTIGLLSRMEIVVAMRLHALIFAAGQGIPLVGISYNEKVNAFLEYIDQNISTPLADVTALKLMRDIDKAYASLPDRERRLEAVEKLRTNERLNRIILSKMLPQ